MCGVYLNRGRFVTFCAFCVSLIFIGCSEIILLAIKIDPQTAKHAANYVWHLCPGTFFMLNFDCMRSFLASMNYTKTPSVITFLTCIIHYFWCYLFVSKLEMKIEGIAISTMITYFCNFFFTLIYVQI